MHISAACASNTSAQPRSWVGLRDPLAMQAIEAAVQRTCGDLSRASVAPDRNTGCRPGQLKHPLNFDARNPMNQHLRNALEVIAFIVVVSLIWIAVPTHPHG